MFRVINKPLKGWIYLMYCKIIECVLDIQCHYTKINQSIKLTAEPTNGTIVSEGRK